jgi:3'(2'), 5'-bisphosphate nucleotidase
MNPSQPALDFKALLDSVRQIAGQAANRILEVYESEFAIALKDDRSPLTQADLASHKAICEALQQLTPDIPILSEESKALPFSVRSRWSRYWLVDPLDGTKEFIKRNGEFTVNIALIEGHESVLGVVHVPVTQVCYFAARGVGAFKLEPGAGTAKRIQTRKVDPHRFVVCGSRSHGSEAVQELIAKLPGQVEFISQGSSLKLCLVAEGRADIYPRFGLTSEWDTAASQCVVEQAGGIVTDVDFRPVTYNAKDNILNPFFVVIGDPSFGWRELLPQNVTAASAP